MAAFTHIFPIGFSDVDHAGIVYFPRFFHYFHLTFEAFFRDRLGARGFVELIDRRRVGFPAVRSECDFRLPLRHGDQVRADMTVTRLGARSIHFRYQLYRVDNDAVPVGEGALSAEGTVVCVATDLAQFRGTEIPQDLRQLFLELLVENE
jgi:4-hydroxybenzoyl-CoA thioesterase